MTSLHLASPTRLQIRDLIEGSMDRRKIEATLKYRDLRAVFAWKKFNNSAYAKDALKARCSDDAEYEETVEKMKAAQNRTCLLPDDETYAGLAPRLRQMLNCELTSDVEYPESELLAWHDQPKNTLRPYQRQAVDALIEARHGGIELATGLGKSTILLYLVKELGLKTVVMCPSRSIASQLLDDFQAALGKKRVGMFGDGKHDASKLVTIAISNSLALVDETSEHWEAFQAVKVFAVDESHLTPADTLQKVCFGLMANAPYRFFVSATQLRNDGLGVVLEGITGQIVMRMTAREGIQAGWLAVPNFVMIPFSGVADSTGYLKTYSDVTRTHRFHLVNNKPLHKLAAQLANRSVDALGAKTLIMIDELPQFQHLLPHLRHKVGFAHAATGDARKKIPAGYEKSDVKKLVAAFNAGEINVLVGTSCVATGTDFTTVGHIIDLSGGASEIALRQRIGRGTRRPPGKNSFNYTDFDLFNVPDLHRHADTRRVIYRDIWMEPQIVNIRA